MASISKRGNTRILQWLDGGRKTVYLGKVTVKVAEEVRRRVEAILASRRADVALDADTAAWLGRIDDDLHAKLALHGLTAPRATAELGPWLDAYVAGHPGKSLTLAAMRSHVAYLVGHFGRERRMVSITEDDAKAWYAHMAQAGYAKATIGRAVKRCRQFWRAAIKAGQVRGTNPFECLPCPPQINKARAAFITEDMARKVLDACPSGYWRLVFALARYGGLRCPSESLALTWEDVLWDQGKIVVHAPKTGTRVIPLFAELRPFLEQAFEDAAEGDVHVLARRSAHKLRVNLERIIRRAGLKQWPRIWHNLRASRQTELAGRFPGFLVAEWIGNSAAVAADHYLQTIDLHFQAAALGTSALQNALHAPAKLSVPQRPQPLPATPENG